MEEIKTILLGMQNQIAGIQGTIIEILKGQDTMKQDIKALQDGQEVMQGDIRTMKQDIKDLQKGQKELKEYAEKIDKDVGRIATEIVYIEKKQAEDKKQLDSHDKIIKERSGKFFRRMA